MDLIETAVWRVPMARLESHLELKMDEVVVIEHRKAEISSVTKVNARNLMRAFEKAYSICGKHYAKVSEQLTLIEQDIKARAAYVNLSIAPAKLKELGLITPGKPAGSDELRKAVVEQDEEYRGLITKGAQIEVIKDLLDTKMEGFKMSFYAVKQIYDSLDNGSIGSTMAPEDEFNIKEN